LCLIFGPIAIYSFVINRINAFFSLSLSAHFHLLFSLICHYVSDPSSFYYPSSASLLSSGYCQICLHSRSTCDRVYTIAVCVSRVFCSAIAIQLQLRVPYTCWCSLPLAPSCTRLLLQVWTSLHMFLLITSPSEQHPGVSPTVSCPPLHPHVHLNMLFVHLFIYCRGHAVA
jgi:hypothetical protein